MFVILFIGKYNHFFYKMQRKHNTFCLKTYIYYDLTKISSDITPLLIDFV